MAERVEGEYGAEQIQVLDGLEAVDDSTNQKTKIKMNLPIVSSADWNAMTEQEKTAYKASHYRFGVEVPDTEGVINAEYMKLLWENPNTTQAFAAQTVTLNSADYDFLLILYSYYTGAYKGYSLILKKDAPSAILSCVVFANNTQTNSVTRAINKVTDTSYAFEDAYNQTITTGVTTAVNNSFNIPIAIYGIKKNFQFKVNAIATDLSTSADHCFLSDGETTVEEAIKSNVKNTTKNFAQNESYTCPSDGYVTIKNNQNYIGSITINDANGDKIGELAPRCSISGHYASESAFVKKGMILECGQNQFTECYFVGIK